MKQAIVLDQNDIKVLICEKYGVKPESVIKSQYSFTVVTEEEPEPVDYPNGACAAHD